MNLLILDIDETLIHTEMEPKKYNINESDYNFDFKFEDKEDFFFTKKRPYLDQFIKYAFDNFEVAIWTSATKPYAESILDNIGIEIKNLKLFYTRENCTLKYQDGIFIKNLQKLRKKKINLSNVLIVDDNINSAVNNYSNLIPIKAFKQDDNDTELLKLISYLEKIKDEPNYRTIEKRGWSNKS